MAVEGFVRTPRVAPPEPPGGAVSMASPPKQRRQAKPGLFATLMPLVLAVAVVGMIAMFALLGKSLLSNPFILLFPTMMLIATVGIYLGVGRADRQPAGGDVERADYFRHLDRVRSALRRAGAAQFDELAWRHPEPGDLYMIAGTRRMWERCPTDSDFGQVRIGVGDHRLATTLVCPDPGSLDDTEPVSTAALRQLVRTHSVVRNLPVAMSLIAFSTITVEGDDTRCRMLVRSMLMELTAFHGPDHVAVAVVCADQGGVAWSWTKWLPHLQHPTARDELGASRMSYASLIELEHALAVDLGERGDFARDSRPTASLRHLVVVIDDGRVEGTERLVGAAGLDSVTVIDLAAPRAGAALRGLQLIVAADAIAVRSTHGVQSFATADAVGVAEAEAFARRLARFRISQAARADDVRAGARVAPGLPALLKIPDVARLDPATAWRSRTAGERLRVPIGITPDGRTVEIDIKEPAESGLGPHGLCIGAADSDRSEFLRTLILALAATHSPDVLNLFLVDVTGAATFAGLQPLPHVAAVVTDLAAAPATVDRMIAALAGELDRRQELLRSAGDFANVADYERARAAGAALEPLPALFVVVDEFVDLVAERTEAADLFAMVGRRGGALWVHLLLAARELGEHTVGDLDSVLTYRIALRRLGSGHLQHRADDPLLFSRTHVAGPYVAPTVAREAGAQLPTVFTAGRVEQQHRGSAAAGQVRPAERAVPATLSELLVSRLAGHGHAARAIWLPPLDESPTVDMLLPEPDWRSPVNRRGELTIPIGVLDRPYEQRRDVLAIDLSGGDGNIVVVGGRKSGVSTTLRTIIVAAAATHSPEQIQFYCLDFGGGTLVRTAVVPHVGSVTDGHDGDRVRRTVAEILALLRQREVRFTELDIPSMPEFRRRKAATSQPVDSLAADRFGDVFLVVDGWPALRREFESVSDQVEMLAAQGLPYGIHVVLSAARWSEIPADLGNHLGTRVELRLDDPRDSEIDRPAAALVPPGQPGRGLARDRSHLLVALPRLDSNSDRQSVVAAIGPAEQQLAGEYPGRSAPAIRMLPVRIERDEVLAAARTSGIELGPTRIAIGLGESELAPVFLDFGAASHFMVFADVASGKTTLLRNIVMGLVAQAIPDEARVIVVDYRRTMLGVVDSDQLAGYSTSAQTSVGMIKEVAAYLAKRLPPPETTPEQQDNSRWSGPEIYIVVDDYDLVATDSPNPLTPLLDYLPQARDIGLHLLVANRSGGAQRAMADPVLSMLADLDADALLMSTPKTEGALLNVPPATLPPGRGTKLSRTHGAEMVQISYLPPSAGE